LAGVLVGGGGGGGGQQGVESFFKRRVENSINEYKCYFLSICHPLACLL
jgi:hypothetical protein